MNHKYKLILISSSISAVHIVKRVQALSDAGFDIEVYAFNKGDKINANYPKEVTVHDLGFTSSGKDYVRRFLHYIPVLKGIFKKYRTQSVIYFVSAFDLALITKYYSQKPYIYHISDLIYGYFPTKLVKFIFKSIDRTIIKQSVKTVVTSVGFTDYLSTPSTHSKFIYQPNNLSNYFDSKHPPAISPINAASIRFAFVGFIRFACIFRFAEVIGKYFPQHSFWFYGRSNSLDKVEELANTYPNIEYKGGFNAPDDLEKVYEKVDIVVSCYEASSLNVRLAEPNKLFEAIYFKKPIIVSSGTFLAKKVSDIHVGYAVDANTEEGIISLVNSITLESINNKLAHIEKIPKETLIDDKSIQIVNAIMNF